MKNTQCKAALDWLPEAMWWIACERKCKNGQVTWSTTWLAVDVWRRLSPIVAHIRSPVSAFQQPAVSVEYAERSRHWRWSGFCPVNHTVLTNSRTTLCCRSRPARHAASRPLCCTQKWTLRVMNWPATLAIVDMQLRSFLSQSLDQSSRGKYTYVWRYPSYLSAQYSISRG